MDNWQDGYVQANGVRLHYWRTGGNKPPVLCIHGTPNNGMGWRRVAQRLQNDYDLILVDRRGFGHSDKPDMTYSLDVDAADVAGLIHALQLGKVVVVGHSAGAAVATLLAASHPDVVRCLVLEDPFWPIFTPEEGTALEEEYKAARRRELGMTHRAIVDELKHRHPGWHEDEYQDNADARLQLSPSALGFDIASYLRWADYVEKIQCPTLLICADPAIGTTVSLEAEEQVHKLNPTIQVTRVTGASHSIRLDRLDTFVDLARTFLAEHTATA